jgi:hypothetical protein
MTGKDEVRFGNSVWARWGSVALVVGLLGVAALLLPRGFDTDLSLIGAGAPVVVLVHDNGSSASLALMEMLDELRDQHTHIRYVIADVNTPNGKGFAQGHGYMPATLLVYDSRGRLVSNQHAPAETSAVRTAIELVR